MKSLRTVMLTAVAALALTMTMTACSSKSSSDAGGGGGQTVSSYSTTTQAAAATSTSLGALNTMSSQMNSGLSMGLSSVPASYAAKFNKRYSGGNIGKLDPTLKMMVDKMAKHSKSPIIQKAVMKAASLKANRAPVDSGVVQCGADGTFTITGTSNKGEIGRTADIFAYDITFANCRDTDIESNGTIHVEVNSSLSTTGSSSSSVTASLTEKLYTSSTSTIFIEQTDLNGIFSDINNITSGSMSANGTFAMTTPSTTTSAQESVVTFAFNNLSDTWTSTHSTSDLSDTDVDDANGTFSITTSYGGTQNFKFTFALDLVEKTQYMNNAAGTEKDWINGTITLSWVPDLSSYGCFPGSITVSTTETDPLIYTNINGTCPVSGTVTINNATVAYGTSGGTTTDIIVTVNGSSQTFASCDALEDAGGACVYN